MKPQHKNQDIKKMSENSNPFKSDKLIKKKIEANPKYPNNYPDEDPGKEFEAGEKEGDFPPDTEMINENLKGTL